MLPASRTSLGPMSLMSLISIFSEKSSNHSAMFQCNLQLTPSSLKSFLFTWLEGLVADVAVVTVGVVVKVCVVVESLMNQKAVFDESKVIP